MEELGASFRAQGCAKLQGLLSPAKVARCLEVFDALDKAAEDSPIRAQLIDNPDTNSRRGLLDTVDKSFHQAFFDAVPELPKACLDLWGTGAKGSVWFCEFEALHKRRGEGSAPEPGSLRARQSSLNTDVLETPFHRDLVSCPCVGEHMVNLWIPFEPLEIEQSLAMVTGTHPTGPFGEAKARDRDWAAEGMLQRWAVMPGDVLALHPHILHGGGGLGAGPAGLVERRALALRFFGDDCHFSDVRAPKIVRTGAGPFKNHREESVPVTFQGLRDGDHFSVAPRHYLLLGPGRGASTTDRVIARL